MLGGDSLPRVLPGPPAKGFSAPQGETSFGNASVSLRLLPGK